MVFSGSVLVLLICLRSAGWDSRERVDKTASVPVGWWSVGQRYKFMAFSQFIKYSEDPKYQLKASYNLI